MVSIRLPAYKSFTELCFLAFALCFYLFLKELFEILFALAQVFLLDHLFVLCTYLLLFNFQGPLPSAFSRRDLYSTTLHAFCQYLFQNFFLFFQNFPYRLPLRATARLLYHFSSLCQYLFLTFLAFFQKS